MTRKPQIVTQKTSSTGDLRETALYPRPEAALRITVWEDAERGSHHSTETNTATPLSKVALVAIGNTHHTPLTSSSDGFLTSHVRSMNAKGFLLSLAALIPFFDARTSSGASPSITICIASSPSDYDKRMQIPAGLFRNVFTSRRLSTLS